MSRLTENGVLVGPEGQAAALYLDGGVLKATASISGVTLTGGTTLSSTLTTTGLIAQTYTNAVAAPSSVRANYTKVLTGIALTGGTIAGVRGEMNLSANLTNAFAYGVQGKLITNAFAVDAGSAHVCAVLGQVDYNGATLTSGHIACLIASVQNAGAVIDATKFNAIYCEAPTFGSGNYINSFLEMYGSAHYAFSVQGPSTEMFVAASDTTMAKKLKILVNGTPYFIALTAAA